MTKPKIRLKKSESAVLLSIYAARLCKEEPFKQERTNRGEFSSLADYGLIEIVDKDWSHGAKITEAGIAHLKKYYPMAAEYEAVAADRQPQRVAFMARIDPAVKAVEGLSYYFPIFFYNPERIREVGGYVRFSFTVKRWHASYTVNFRSDTPYVISFSSAITELDCTELEDFLKFIGVVKSIADLITKTHEDCFTDADPVEFVMQ